jgi:large subunit ribosomal protein L24
MNRSQAKKSMSNQRFKAHIKRGDTVFILSGKDKGKTGVVRKVLLDKQKVIVEGINVVKKSVKANPMLGNNGGFVSIEAALPLSKVMFYDLKTSQPTRLGKRLESIDGIQRYQRFSKKTGELIEA